MTTEQESRIWACVYAAEFQGWLQRLEKNGCSFDEGLTEHGYSAAERARVMADEAVIRFRETRPYHKSRI